MTNPNEEAIRHALYIGGNPELSQRTIDITTTGARTGQARRIEISFWDVDGRLYLGSGPGPRSWFANLVANPDFTVHLKHGLSADVPATATAVVNPAIRRHVFAEILRQAGRRDDVEGWVASSPLVEFDPS